MEHQSVERISQHELASQAAGVLRFPSPLDEARFLVVPGWDPADPRFVHIAMACRAQAFAAARSAQAPEIVFTLAVMPVEKPPRSHAPAAGLACVPWGTRHGSAGPEPIKISGIYCGDVLHATQESPRGDRWQRTKLRTGRKYRPRWMPAIPAQRRRR